VTDLVLPESQRKPERYINIEVNLNKLPARAFAFHLNGISSRFGALRSDGINNWDLSVAKQWKLAERFTLRFQTQFLNAFNHVTFNAPNLTSTNTAFGTVTSESSLPRTIRWAFASSTEAATAMERSVNVAHFLTRTAILACLPAQAATCNVDRSSWPQPDEVIPTAVARLCASNLSVSLLHTSRADLGDEGYSIERQGNRWTVSANSSRGSLWGAYALAEAPTPRPGVSKPYFPVREWWSAAFQANFNLPLGGAFDRPIEEISAIVERTIREAPKYGINTLQLMGRAGEGGIDISWFLEYDRFPKLRARRLGHGLAWRVEEIRKLAREAHRHGLDFLLWDHELVFPPALLEAYPEIRGVDYPVCFSHPFIREFVTAKFDEFFTRMPEVDGITLTFAETRGYNVLEHGGCRCDLCRRTGTADKVRQVTVDVYQAHARSMQSAWKCAAITSSPRTPP